MDSASSSGVVQQALKSLRAIYEKRPAGGKPRAEGGECRPAQTARRAVAPPGGGFPLGLVERCIASEQASSGSGGPPEEAWDNASPAARSFAASRKPVLGGKKSGLCRPLGMRISGRASSSAMRTPPSVMPLFPDAGERWVWPSSLCGGHAKRQTRTNTLTRQAKRDTKGVVWGEVLSSP